MNRSLLAVLCGSLFLAACHAPPPPSEQYFRVTDPATGKVYYATDRGSSRAQNGALTFRDGKTGAIVTLQNSEVLHVGQSEYLANIEIKPGETAPPPPGSHEGQPPASR
jgi:hypothetical protein